MVRSVARYNLEVGVRLQLRQELLTENSQFFTLDSGFLMTQLQANGFEVEHEAKKDDSEIVIINTCGFIDNAKQESIDTILRYAKAKEDGDVEKVYVTGCLSERYKEDC